MLVEEYYDFEEIYNAADCRKIAADFTTVENERCAATWRGGSNITSVSLTKDGYCDHGSSPEDKGGAMKLYGKFTGLDFDNFMEKQEIQQRMGRMLGLTPAKTLQKAERENSRVDRLKNDGYEIKEVYEYTDEDGITKHSVERWECEGKKKEFVQRGPHGEYRVKGIKTYLYKLHEWVGEEYVVLCEGEKDANTVKEKLGFFATTNASGAGRWEPHYTEWLKGKRLVILADNDKAGVDRATHLTWELKDACPSIKIVTFEGEEEGFDITDFVDKYGVAAAKKKISKTPLVDKSKLMRPTDSYNEIVAAKERNKHDFRNYIEVTEDGDDGVKKIKVKPRHIDDLVKELHERFLGFPRKITGQMCMFDHDRNTGKIVRIENCNDLMQWIMRKSKRFVNWKNGPSLVSQSEFFCAAMAEAKEYDTISYSPDIKQASDTYYSHPPIPPPDPQRKYLNDFCKFFHMERKEDEILLRCFIASPLYNQFGIPKPIFVFDSHHGKGSGKTSIPELISFLYTQNGPIKVSQSLIKKDFNDVIKRLVSESGRMNRILLLDNITGEFKAQELADLSTSFSVSGKAPYGRGEEQRRNNITITITSNNATLDGDIVDRSYFVHVRKAERTEKWKTDVLNYIQQYRYNIISDTIDIIKKGPSFSASPQTRAPEFEKDVLQSFCATFDDYSSVIKKLHDSKASSNLDDDLSAIVIDMIRGGLLALNISPDEEKAFIHSRAFNKWVFFSGAKDVTVASVMCLAKDGKIPFIHPKINIYPHNGENRRRGIMWNWEKDGRVRVVGVDHQNNVKEVLV